MLSAYYPSIHLMLETFSIVISFTIFLIYWNSYEEEQELGTSVLGLSFLGVALFDMIHMLSVKGMPDFFSPSSVEKGIFFWLFARYFESFGLLFITFAPKMKISISKTRLGIIPLSLAFLGIFLWGTFALETFPRTFDENGLTPFKKTAEYIVLFAHIAIIAGLIPRKMKGDENYNQLIIASVFIVSSETCFTLYSTHSDLYNLIGHIFKNIAFFFIYRAILVRGLYRPYEQLQKSQSEILWNQERMRMIVQEMPVMVVAMDSDQTIVVWNKECERVTGFTSEEICYQHGAINKLIPDLSYRREVSVELMKNQNDLRNFNIKITAKNGSTKIISWSCIAGSYPISGWSYWGTGIDHSDRHDLEKQLWQSQKMEALGQLAGGVAHDINNMLTIISASAQVLKKSASSPESEKINKNSESIIRNVARATAYLKQLSSFSRKQVGKPVELNLNNEIQDLRTMLDPLLGSGIKLHFNFAAKDFIFLAERSQLEQIVLNLAVNAKDAMNGTGEIWIETTSETVTQSRKVKGLTLKNGQYVIIQIRDNGSGISEEIQDRIFEPFFTTKGKDKGTGLGLSTVFGIVRSLNGVVDLTSSPGKGTEFRIYLPLLSQSPIVIPEAINSQNHNVIPFSTKPKALVVDDDNEIQSVIAEYVAEMGYEIISANNGVEALEKIDTHSPPHLIVTDIMMPKMNGLELVQKARKINPQQKVIFITGYADPSIMGCIHQMGPDVSIIDKPFTADDLQNAILKFAPDKKDQKAA
ncbi:MAG: hypothetical protein BroJett040_20770 [Oligoflexia bacterium]|nr:MAG: hypothetical protein BroJett040_20770 [Oligoflexia bacterium]